MSNLNTKKIRELTKPGRYGDGDGLFLHVRKGGSRQWVLRTTVNGRRVDMGLGSVDIVTLAEAREAAHESRRLAKQGVDPVHAKRVEAGIPTYEEAAEKVWQQHKPSWRNPKHADQWISTQRTYVFPVIGDMRVDQVTSAHILKILSPIWLSKGETARRVRQRMRAVFDWAKAAGYRSGDNPLDGIRTALPKQDRTRRHHPAMPWKDLPDFMQRLSVQSAVSARALEMVILTATRSGETRMAKWDEIDFENRIWTIPGERMKMRKEHRVPLALAALDVLAKCRELGSDYIFPGTNLKKSLSDMAFAQLFKRMGIEGITTHGFRSTFRDWTSETDSAPREIAEAALAHAVGDATVQAYARSDLLERRRQLMERWAEFATGFDIDGDKA